MIAVRNIDYQMFTSFWGVESGRFLQEQCSRLEISISSYLEKLAKQGTIAYKIIDDKIVSLVIGYTSDPSYSTSYITQVFTLNGYRGKHLARELMKEYIEYVKTIGLDGCWLTTREDNKSAIKLYQSVGFEICDGYYNEERKIIKLRLSF